MATQQGKQGPKADFVDIGVISCWDTDSKGVKRRDKNQAEFSAGSGTVVINGVAHKLYATVRKGRPGQLSVGLSLIVEPVTPPVK